MSVFKVSMAALGLLVMAGCGTSTELDCADNPAGASCDLSPPLQVTDLSVRESSTEAVRLAWTQVGDGQGSAADYLLRYSVPPIQWDDADPTDVIISGTNAGEELTHAFTGLDAGTTYEFQLVSVRWDLDGRLSSLVLGPLSNLVSATTASPDGPLLAGVVSASPGDGLVTLSGSPASGGVPPYQYQWHRATNSGFSPAAGNALAGAASLNATDAAVTNGTTYYYRLVVTDEEGAVASSSEVSATPSANAQSLQAGAVSAGAGDGVVTLSGSQATGGVQPYLYQWHRATTSGFVPGAGNALPGATSLNETDATVTNGTTYYYRLVVIDDEGSVASSTQVSATPQPPGAFNEPGGMTELASFDGTTKDWDTNDRVIFWGQAYGDPAEGSTGPFTGRWEVVDDPTNPVGSGKVLRQNWQVGDGDGHNAVIEQDLRLGGSNLDEIYIRYHVRYSDNWQWHSGADKMQLWGVGNTSQQFIVQPRPNGTIRWINQVGSGNGVDTGDYLALDSGGNPVIWAPRGEWWLVEVHMKANSDNSAADGFLKIWWDGVLIAQWRSFNTLEDEDLGDGNRLWTNNFADPGFFGYKWYYWGGSGDTKTVNDYIDWGEFYVSGKVN